MLAAERPWSTADHARALPAERSHLESIAQRQECIHVLEALLTVGNMFESAAYRLKHKCQESPGQKKRNDIQL